MPIELSEKEYYAALTWLLETGNPAAEPHSHGLSVCAKSDLLRWAYDPCELVTSDWLSPNANIEDLMLRVYADWRGVALTVLVGRFLYGRPRSHPRYQEILRFVDTRRAYLNWRLRRRRGERWDPELEEVADRSVLAEDDRAGGIVLPIQPSPTAASDEPSRDREATESEARTRREEIEAEAKRRFLLFGSRYDDTREHLGVIRQWASQLEPTARAKVSDALDLMFELHLDQLDRPGRQPYVEHTAEVARNVVEWMAPTSPDIVIAACLHDAVEDRAERLAGCADLEPGEARDRALTELRRRFGEHVAALVASVTNPDIDAIVTSRHGDIDGRERLARKDEVYTEHVLAVLRKEKGPPSSSWPTSRAMRCVSTE